MKIFGSILLLIILFTGCYSYSCNELTGTFQSEENAIERIRSSSFRFTDEFKLSDTSLSWISEVDSWITSANYYSCDGEKGYLIYNVSRGADYIRINIPIELWKGLKDTSAKGAYYDRYIKDNYHGISIEIDLDKLEKSN